MPLPTFDEWYADRHNGSSFEHDHMQDGAWIASAMKTLAQLTREYVSEIAQLVEPSSVGTPVHFTRPTVLGTAPAGTTLIAVGLDIIAINAETPPCFVTPGGLVPLHHAPLSTEIDHG